MTLVTAVWVLLTALTSLVDVSTAVALMVVGPGPSARQRSVRSRTSSPLPLTVPRLHSTTVADNAAQLAPAGKADTKLAPAGTLRRSRVLSAASAWLLSMRRL
jgi:hypothetical protein